MESDSSEDFAVSYIQREPAATSSALVPVQRELIPATPRADDAATGAIMEAHASRLPLPAQQRPEKSWKPLRVHGIARERSVLEHRLVCERMRARKRKKSQIDNDRTNADVVEHVLAASGRSIKFSKIDRRCSMKAAQQKRKSKALTLLRKFQGRGKSGFHCTAAKDVMIAFDQSLRIHDSARAQGVSASTVVRTRVAVAQACRELGDRQLKRWLELCRTVKPLMAVHVRKWDEARSKLQVPLKLKCGQTLKAGQRVQPLSVFQQRRKLFLTWPDRCIEIEIPIIPTPITSTSAGNVCRSLHHSRQAKAAQDTVELIMQSATCSLELDGCDGAYGNIKYCHYHLQKDRLPTMGRAFFVCGNHCNAITDSIHTAMLRDNACDGDYQSRLYGFATFLRGSTNFLRLLASVETVLQEMVKVVRERPPPEALAIGDLLQKHMVHHVDEYSSAYEDTSKNFRIGQHPRSMRFR